MSEGSGGIVKDTPYGDIQVFRENRFDGRIEYTIFLRDENGEKRRADISGTRETWERIEDDPEGPGIADFIFDTLKYMLENDLCTTDGECREYRID